MVGGGGEEPERGEKRPPPKGDKRPAMMDSACLKPPGLLAPVRIFSKVDSYFSSSK